MNDTNREAAGPIRLRRYAWTLIGLWTLAVGAMLTWELIDEHHQALEIARGEARGAFQKDLLFRRWVRAMVESMSRSPTIRHQTPISGNLPNGT